MIYAATDDVSRCGMCSSRTSRVFRSTRVPMADCCSFPMMRSPSVASARSGLRAGMAARISSEYEITWRQLAAVLGTRAPWFPSELRDRDAIAVWQPGDLPTIVPAYHVELPVGRLLELAADEPDGSPAAAVCTWLARRLRHADTEHARESTNEIRDAGLEPGSDCHSVDIAAVSAPLQRADDTDLDEIIQRAGWAQIVERCDVIAAADAHIVLAGTAASPGLPAGPRSSVPPRAQPPPNGPP